MKKYKVKNITVNRDGVMFGSSLKNTVLNLNSRLVTSAIWFIQNK